jgi:CheY-like chemotaxis protein
MVTPPIHTVLLVDDNPDDCEIVREAWGEIPVGQELRFVHDGIELLDYLYRRGSFLTENALLVPV